ncbi:6212_t:CDS:2 [Funneliformis caledonium]|uniref:6212_t:CDS:1 n=1 Tax=Funneliformis caledonium TaxID=1117310 RepID=A0A9N8ZKY7_9GLOM|nr:6212_t:CDS:2 [Funneliformis caledonium]
MSLKNKGKIFKIKFKKLNQHKQLNERKILEFENKEINHYRTLAQKSENEVKVINEQIQELDHYKTLAQQFENEVNATKRQIQKLNQYKLLLENEKNQYKVLAEKSEKDTETTKEQFEIIKEQHLKKIQRIQNRIDEQEGDLQQLDKEKVELDNYQSALGKATNFQLNNDIADLSDNLKNYVTNLKQNIVVNMKEVRKLLLHYKCPTEIKDQKSSRLLIQAVLQRHVIEIIFANATQYFHVSGRQQLEHLESQIVNKESELNRGFEDTSRENNTVYEHAFITQCKQQLNDIMNGLRTINDKQKKSDSEKYAVTIIREVVKIFYFRLKVQEPVVQHNWFSYNAKLDKTLMEGIS